MDEANAAARRNSWREKLSPRMLAALAGVFLFGLIAHGMGMLNKYSYHDDIFALFGTGTTIASGRWMLHVLGWLETLLFGDGHFSLPLMNGLFSIACAAGVTCLLIDLLKIENPVYCAGMGCLIVSFPTMTGLFGYMYTVPYYLLAMLMMAGSAVLICRADKWWAKVLAVGMGACSVGVYQAFLPLLLSIPLLYDMALAAEKDEKPAYFLKKAAVQMACILCTVGLYFVLNQFFLRKFQLELNQYMGINQMGVMSPAVFLQRVGRAYREFFLPARNVMYDMYPMHAWYLHEAMICADVLLAVRLVLITWKRNRFRAALLTLLFALFPLGCNFIFVMSEMVHGLMTYGLIAKFALFVWLIDRLEISRPKLRRAVSLTAAGVMFLNAVMYARFSNQCYLKAEFQQQEAISWYTTLAARIKGTEGYRDDLPVAFLNAEQAKDQTLYNIGELDFIHLDAYADTMDTYINSYAWASFMERWCGFGPVYDSGESLRELPEVLAMPHYPDDGSIQLIDDVIVVNF